MGKFLDSLMAQAGQGAGVVRPRPRNRFESFSARSGIFEQAENVPAILETGRAPIAPAEETQLSRQPIRLGPMVQKAPPSAIGSAEEPTGPDPAGSDGTTVNHIAERARIREPIAATSEQTLGFFPARNRVAGDSMPPRMVAAANADSAVQQSNRRGAGQDNVLMSTPAPRTTPGITTGVMPPGQSIPARTIADAPLKASPFESVEPSIAVMKRTSVPKPTERSGVEDRDITPKPVVTMAQAAAIAAPQGAVGTAETMSGPGIGAKKSSGSQEPPSITISIGTVEIKASGSPVGGGERTRPERKKADIMGLDQFLSRQAAGRNR